MKVLFIALVSALLSAQALASDNITVGFFFLDGEKTVLEMPVSSCNNAFECFSKVANLSCDWTPAVGVLACNGAEKTCFVTGVKGVNADYEKEKNWWAFYVNGKLASTGVSCYQPIAGDEIELRFQESIIDMETTSLLTAVYPLALFALVVFGLLLARR